MKKMRSLFRPFEWAMILSVIGFTIYFSIINQENSLWYLLIDGLSAICGIFCVVLCAKGKKSQYIWGLFNIIGYVIIAWINHYYGEVMLNALYYLPSQFIGFYLWKKHMNQNTNEVEGKKLDFKQSVLLVMISMIAIFGYKLILDALGGAGTLLDSCSTVLSIFANLLMLLRFREQWLLWIIIDIVTVIMWLLVGDYIMVTMWAVYLVNAFYGYYHWTKIAGGEYV